jgi:TatD DNase family protein
MQSNHNGAVLIDTHAHLDFVDYDEDREDVVARAQAAGVSVIINVGIEPGGWAQAVSVAEEFPGVYAAAAVHPNSADQTNDEVMHDLARLCAYRHRNKVVAIGETGLDYYREYVPHEVQRESFRAHLDLARQLHLPVIIHNRDAHADIVDILKRDGAGTHGVMHSFSGDLVFARECMRLGYMIALSGPVTFRNAADKHLIARSVPLDHLLVETDCPFLTPEPFRGRRNEPAYMQHTAQAIANLREVTFEEVAAATTANARRLFGIA